MRVPALVACAVVALACASAGRAQTPSSGGWTDAAGAAHAAQTPAVRLHRVAVHDGIELRVENTLAGPVEVRLVTPRPARGGDGALPASITVPAWGRVVAARSADGQGLSTLQLEIVPGVPGARHRNVEYVYPLRGAPLHITQGFGGGFSHTDAENRYAVDFAVDEGTPVLAARDGVVMQFESGITGPARGAVDDVARTNFVRVLHDDGTMALYAHLQRDGVTVRLGEHVRRGQIIGFSGNTGASSGPHLHFAVHANAGLQLQSVPFRMFGPGGILRFTAPGDAAAP